MVNLDINKKKKKMKIQKTIEGLKGVMVVKSHHYNLAARKLLKKYGTLEETLNKLNLNEVNQTLKEIEDNLKHPKKKAGSKKKSKDKKKSTVEVSVDSDDE